MLNNMKTLQSVQRSLKVVEYGTNV